jgi:hypothetical protein
MKTMITMHLLGERAFGFVLLTMHVHVWRHTLFPSFHFYLRDSDEDTLRCYLLYPLIAICRQIHEILYDIA